MWRLKGCPRCKGDMMFDGNVDDGRRWLCLQCGHGHHELVDVIESSGLHPIVQMTHRSWIVSGSQVVARR
jgi:hypothetical protein